MEQPFELLKMRKRHSPEEIEAKLRQAEKMITEGRRQADIARALDISVMTYHRWRKKPPTLMRYAAQGTSRILPMMEQEAKGISQLQIENSRLRVLVTDLLLEKVKLEEALRMQAKRRRRSK
jgi:putative transposase